MNQKASAPPMSRAEFVQWLAATSPQIVIDGPSRVVPCDCGDLNCRGWRLVPRES